MDETTDYNNNTEKPNSRRNHITERNMKKQHQGIESTKRT